MDATYDAKSFWAGYHAGRGIKGHGVSHTGAGDTGGGAGGNSGGAWQYHNASFKLGLAVGFLLRLPGEGGLNHA